jgi:hypothetical protein
MVQLVVRAMAGEWIMGEDFLIDVSAEHPLRHVQLEVMKRKRIPGSRYTLHRGGNNQILDGSKVDWEAGRLGFKDGAIILVRPLPESDWLWQSTRWYQSQAIEQMKAIFEEEQRNGEQNELELSFLEQRIELPPPLQCRKISLRQIIRANPEHFVMNCNLRGTFCVLFRRTR